MHTPQGSRAFQALCLGAQAVGGYAWRVFVAEHQHAPRLINLP